MKLLLATILFLLPFFALAAIYQTQDAQGNIIYTDQPSDKATPVELDPTNVVKNPQIKTAKKKGSKVEPSDAEKTYTEFKITDPTDQLTIQNQPTIPVVVSVKPDLLKGDKIAIFMDGKQVTSAAPGTQFALVHPDRGQHTLQAKLFGAGGQEKMATNSITVFIHYARVGGN